MHPTTPTVTRAATPCRFWPLVFPVLALVALAALVVGTLAFLGGLALFGLAWAGGAASPESPWYKDKDDTIQQMTTTFMSGGKPIAIERFEPKKEGKYPAILVVHGADGLQHEVWLKTYRGYAQELARQGYVALLVHYMDRTGSKAGDPKTSAAHFVTWLQTLGDAVTYASELPGVDGKRIGLLGVSLGAYLSLSLGSMDPRIKAIVEVFGGIPQPVADNLKTMPPVLILHGDADMLVPVAEARKLEKVLQDRKLPYETKIYPGQGHGFRGEAALDSVQRSLQFFEKHLKARLP